MVLFFKLYIFVSFDVAKIGQGDEDECYCNVIFRLMQKNAIFVPKTIAR